MIPLPVVDALDSIAIPVPCPVPWEEMYGDHRTRFCNKCSQDVHDVSELTRDEAVQLLTGGANLPCLRVYRRPDGRVMTSDCTTKRERVWKWLRRYSAPAAALFSLVVFGCVWSQPTPGIPCRPEPDVSTAHEQEHLAQSESVGLRAPQDGVAVPDDGAPQR